MSDERKVIDLSAVLEERDELAICRLWDDFRDAAAELFEYRDYESLVLVLKAIEKVKTTIHKPPRDD
jgi:hypothetical protein